jgi:hypothetical protein
LRGGGEKSERRSTDDGAQRMTSTTARSTSFMSIAKPLRLRR